MQKQNLKRRKLPFWALKEHIHIHFDIRYFIVIVFCFSFFVFLAVYAILGKINVLTLPRFLKAK